MIKDFFLAPYFTYLLVPFYLLTNLHPRALIYFVIFFNLLFFCLCFFLVKNVFNEKIAYFFLIFWSVNPLLIEYDTIPWWPITIPLGIIIVWYMLYKIYQTRKKRDCFILGLTLGFFNNMHFQFIFIFFFSIFFLIFKHSPQKKLLLKSFLFLIGGYLLTFFPLFVFDLRHNFLNIKAFYQFFFSDNLNLKKDINVWWEVFGNFIQPLIFYKNSILLTKSFYFFILLIIVFLIKKEKNFYQIIFKSSLFLWSIFPFFFILYGQRPSEYYFVFLYPFIYIIIIRLFTLMNKNFILVIFLIAFIALENNKIKAILKNNHFGLYYKDQTAKKLRSITNGKKFSIIFSTPLGQNYGFSYLIDWYQIKQTGDFNDPLIEIRIPPQKGDIEINKEIGIKIPKGLR